MISTSIYIMVVQASRHSFINLELSAGVLSTCIYSGQSIPSPLPMVGGPSHPTHLAALQALLMGTCQEGLHMPSKVEWPHVALLGMLEPMAMCQHHGRHPASPGTGGKGTLGMQAPMESCWAWHCCLQSMAGIEMPQPLPLPHGLAVHSCSLRNSCCHGFPKENTSPPPSPPPLPTALTL